MTKLLRRLCVLLCLIALVVSLQSRALAVVQHAQVDSPQLEPGKAVERKSVGGESHTYLVKLMAGQYVLIAAEQNGIDVSLTLTAPDGQQVVALNLIRPGGIESLAAEVKSDGDHRLGVRVAGAASSSGAYLLRAETRAPTAEDHKRIAAQALVLRAKQLIRQGPGSASQVIEASEKALVVWRELNDQQMIASSLIEIGGAHFLLAHHDKASEYARQALTVARAARDRGGEQYALYLIANIASSLNQYEQSILNAEQALQIAREIKDRFYEAGFLGQIGMTHYTLGRYQKAAEYYEQALRMAREDRDRRIEAVALVRLGTVHMGLSQSEKAIELIEPAVEIFRTFKDKQSEGMALSNLGAAHSYLSHYDKAIEILQQSVGIARETKNPGMEGNALLTLAGIQATLGSYETAIEFNESALKLTRQIRDRVLEARLLLQRSNLFALLNRNDNAIDYGEQALKINRETKYLNGQGDTLSSLGSAHARQDHHDKAIEYYEQSLSVRRELKDKEGVSVSLTHGLLDSGKPGLSALVLSMVDEKGEPRDGFLTVNDIYNLKLPADLVVLSACQTGLGKEIKGEGLVGLTGGFMYAGAARVVVSLWSVNDKATAELMTKFYEKMLKRGEPPAAALRAAQVEMWSRNSGSHLTTGPRLLFRASGGDDEVSKKRTTHSTDLHCDGSVAFPSTSVAIAWTHQSDARRSQTAATGPAHRERDRRRRVA